MELNEDARKMMESRIAKIMKGIDVPESDKTEIKMELISNYEDASITKARARGASIVEKADMAAALEFSEEPEEIASAYMGSYVNSLTRAGLFPRSLAFIIDSFIITIITWVTTIPFMLPRFIDNPPPSGPPPTIIFIIFMQFSYLLGISNLVIIFVYFVICEGYMGFTPGKWLLSLKVIKSDGKKAGYKDTMLRSISKLVIFGIVADAVSMVLYHRKDRQRIFDRIAGTIVIKR